MGHDGGDEVGELDPSEGEEFVVGDLVIHEALWRKGGDEVTDELVVEDPVEPVGRG